MTPRRSTVVHVVMTVPVGHFLALGLVAHRIVPFIEIVLLLFYVLFFFFLSFGIMFKRDCNGQILTGACRKTTASPGSSTTTSEDGEACFCMPSSNNRKSNALQDVGADDDVIVQELNNLTIAERQKVYEDIHGVSEVVKETPELINSSIAAMNQALKRLRKRSAYERAAFLSPSYVHDKNFRLRFLRSDHFDATQAAKRMAAYFELKYELFGLDALVRDLTIEQDMDEETMQVVYRCISQLLPEPDSAGRRVIMLFFQQAENCRAILITKMSMYMWEKFTKSEEAQRNGIVVVLYEAVSAGEYFFSFDLDKVSEATRFFMSMPLNVKAWHICYHDARSKPLMEVFKLAIGTPGRVRFRMFYGSDVESRYHLMSFGIPAHLIPVNEDGYLDRTRQLAFIEEQKEYERQHDVGYARRPPPYPTSKDVLLGKGQPFQQHEGNILLHQLVSQNFEEYQKGSRKEMRELFLRVIEQLKQGGSRFLRKAADDDTGVEWVPVPEKEVYKKVSHTFRNQSQKMIRQKERNDHLANFPVFFGAPFYREQEEDADHVLSSLGDSSHESPYA